MPHPDSQDARRFALDHAVRLYTPTMTGGRDAEPSKVVAAADAFAKFVLGEDEPA